MPFELFEQSATIRSVTPRAERHGEDTVPAVSIGLSITAANTILDKLSKTLRQALYTAPEGQDQLPGVDEHLPLLRTCDLGSMHLDVPACEGWMMHIDWGIDDEGSIDCGSCKIDKWRLNAMQGGLVELDIRIGTSDVDADSLGKLSMLIGQEVDITLTAPVAKEPAIDASKDGDWPFPGGEKPKDPEAGDLFAAAHGDPDDDTDGDGSETDTDSDGPADLEDKLETALDKTDLPRTVKYRSPQTGETWSGRGKRPRWLEAAIATGQRLEDFAVQALEV